VIDTIPSEQHEVAAQLAAGTAEPFHVGRFPKGHRQTDFARWATSTIRYEVDYEECYEPYVIGSRRLLPQYDERFRGYGMNKIQHLYACSAAGLRFVVEPGVFVAAAEHSLGGLVQDVRPRGGRAGEPRRAAATSTPSASRCSGGTSRRRSRRAMRRRQCRSPTPST